ncbi:MAG TPA: hypothetical protein VJI69_07500 [Bacteroidia bacterium]|nr:hypothetical protein [Bacteroidia bacterium]
MKKAVAYFLIIIVMFAFNYKAVCYLLNPSADAIAFVFDFEKEKSESEKSDEKEEKKEISEFFINRKNNSFVIIHKLTFDQMHNFLFIPSDFSKSLFMPPEFI